MLENLNEIIFNDIGKTLKKISKFLFNYCLVIGAIVVVVGVITFLSGIDEYTSFSEGLACTLEDAVERGYSYASCYYGKVITKIGFWVILSSFGVLPLYAFGELVDSAKKSKDILQKMNDLKANQIKNKTTTSRESTETMTKEAPFEHKWMCNTCGLLRDKSPCPHCGNE